jgi:3-dehydroquinate synthetase
MAPPPVPMPKVDRPKVVKVAIRASAGVPAASYEVLIGSGLLTRAIDGLAEPPRRVLAVVDANLPRQTVEPALRALDNHGIRWGIAVVPATEADKSLTTLERVLAEAGRLRLERGDAILSVGGGIVTDLAGFAAAVYRRGVRVVQCPTTLLAMVDASVGGKTAANLLVPGDNLSSDKPRLVKNLIGAFHQPARVICDLATLQTLPGREFRAGMAECIKHGLIAGGVGDTGLLEWTGKHLAALRAGEHKALAELVARNVALKARVVQDDPHELSTRPDGGRMMLNLGHTFAHALEPLPGLSWPGPDGQVQLGPLKHGEAVGLGLLAACHAACSLKLAAASVLETTRALLAQVGLPTAVRGLPESSAVLHRMGDDKKVSGGKLRLILPVKGGRSRVVMDPPEAVVLRAIDALRA